MSTGHISLIPHHDHHQLRTRTRERAIFLQEVTYPPTRTLRAQVGAIRTSDTQWILLKNVGDATVGLVAWWIIGYAIASGKDAGHITGRSYFFFTGECLTKYPLKLKHVLHCTYFVQILISYFNGPDVLRIYFTPRRYQERGLFLY